MFPTSYFSWRMSLVGSYVHEKAEGLEEYFAALGNIYLKIFVHNYKPGNYKSSHFMYRHVFSSSWEFKKFNCFIIIHSFSDFKL